MCSCSMDDEDDGGDDDDDATIPKRSVPRNNETSYCTVQFSTVTYFASEKPNARGILRNGRRRRVESNESPVDSSIDSTESTSLSINAVGSSTPALRG